jgi:hypothetical protein
MNKFSNFCVLGLASVTLSACVVAPVALPHRPVVVTPVPAPTVVYVTPPPPPAGVVYVAPAYAMPAPGYVWHYNARYGWGWHHPQYGWHLGWRG